MRGGGKIILYTTVFVCGISTMGVELSASRLLAPFFGTSLYVWTNIIGIIMVSLTIGYFIGGRISDKHPDTTLFYTITLTAGILIGVIPFLSSFILPLATKALSTLSYNDFLLSFAGSLLLFAIPIALLGAIIPFAVRLNIKKLENSGKTSGRIYAVSTLGSIIGVYLPALLLIPTIGTRFTIIGFSLLLIAVSSIALLITTLKGVFKKTFFSAIIICFVFTSIVLIPHTISSEKDVIYEGESPYYYLKIRQINDTRYLLANQGRGVWSKNIQGKAFTGRYWDYLVVGAAFNNDTKNVLIIGLAAGTTAKSFTVAYPNVTIDGVEIDPLVIKIGKKYFNMTYHNLHPIVADGRLFVKTTQNKYDVIVLDVYKDLTIPYHMTTKEFFQEVKKILQPDGILEINVAAGHGTKILEILGSTLLQVFPKVYVVKVPNSYNYILFAEKTQRNLNNIKEKIMEKRDTIPFSIQCLKEDRLTLKSVFTEAALTIEEFHTTSGIYFTDDYAPIEEIIGFDAFFPIT